MLANLTPDLDLAARVFEALRAHTHDGVGITREAYGPGERLAHEIVFAEAAAIGLEIATDHMGNRFLTLPGADRAAPGVIVGSHLDSVARGGNYDGAAGVVAGLAAVAGMARAGFTLGCDITVMVIRAEEAGSWFPTSYPGSRGALGPLAPEELDIRRQDSGRPLGEHVAEEGFDPEAARAGRVSVTRERVAAFVELPGLMDRRVRDGLAKAARDLGIPHKVMLSGGRHDAAAFAAAGIPTGMIFVRNQNGSHNPDEDMRMEDFAKAAAVLQRWMAEASS
jgi:N-carbamoyl-L-amino-acid hydrolase